MKEKILVIDDEKDDLIVIKRILQKAGYSVSTASKGSNALNFIKKYKYNLIILDILMPRLSGYEILRLLREKNNAKLKIAYISIVPKDEVVMDGADGFIKKPFSPESLLKGVKDLLNKSKGRKKR